MKYKSNKCNKSLQKYILSLFMNHAKMVYRMCSTEIRDMLGDILACLVDIRLEVLTE